MQGRIEERRKFPRLQHNEKNTMKRQRQSPEYFAWRGMINRCVSPRNAAYKDYGGRGVTVCPQWRVSLDAFLADVGPRPSEHHSVDRIDNNGNYEPGNVRWATLNEQANNKRRSVRVTSSGGETLTVSQWARKVNIGKSTLLDRVARGWPVDRVLGAAPSRSHPRTYIDMAGQRFGRLVAVYREEPKPKKLTRWVCRCDCGTFTTASRLDLVTDHKKSCGCLRVDTTKALHLTRSPARRSG